MKTKKISFTSLILDIFKDGHKHSLGEIYAIINKNSEIAENMSQKKLAHRVRSCIYSLKKSGKIEQIGKAQYQIK